MDQRISLLLVRRRMEDKGSNGFGSCNVIQEFPPQLLRFVGGIFVGLIGFGNREAELPS